MNLVEVIIRYQKLHLTCRESPGSCTAFKSQRKLLTSEVIFVVDRYERFMENKNITRIFFLKKNIEPHQNFTGSYIQSVETLGEVQDTQDIER